MRKIHDKNYVEIQGVKQNRLRVRGLFQIPEDAETTSALLIRKHGDYYLHVTAFLPIQAAGVSAIRIKGSVGVDFGITNRLSLSNGLVVNYGVPGTIKLKRLQRELARRKRFGKNWCKTSDKLEK